MKIKALVIILMITAVLTTGCFDEEKKNHAPEAKADVDNNSPNIGEEIKFTASKSNDEDGDELEFTWDFDASNGKNDSDSQEETVTHVYWDAGDGEKDYIVTLSISDGELFDTDEITVTVKKPPSKYVCDFKASRKYGVVNETDEDTIKITENTIPITFNASESSDTDAEIVSYEWDFSFNQSEDFQKDREGIEVEYDFPSGLYPVMLKIENDLGKPNTKLEYIQINYLNYYENLSVNWDTDELINFPLNTLGVELVVVTLSYDDKRSNPLEYTDMDIFVYNTSADNQNDENEVGNHTDHDDNNQTQIYRIEIFDPILLNEKEETIWSIKIDDTDLKSGEVNCDLMIEVYYRKRF